MSNFIYVFCEKDRDTLVDLKYKMIKSDDVNHIFIFLNENEKNFSYGNMKYVLTDILTF